jgi:hypothetical protein
MLLRASVPASVLFAVLSLAACGFEGGLSSDNLDEGTRCNPYDSHNECSSGAVCAGAAPSSVTIQFCAENYCCSVDSNGTITSSNPNCQPGCNGGAQSICTATGDPATCEFADSGVIPPPVPEGGGD